MMKYVMLLIVATLAAAGFALADVVGKVDNTAHAQAGTPSNVGAANGANPGEAVVSWDAVAGASAYRVGWLAVADYEANIDNDRWRERFAYSDVNASSSYTVTRLTPGIAYYFITGRKQGDDIVWSAWATLPLNSGALPCPSQPAVAPSTTSALRVSNGSRLGQVVVSWDVVAGTTGYRVGWLAVPDFEANRDNDRWRERFAYSDISGGSSYYTVTRLTPAIAYYFILGRKQGDDIVWSQWAALALNADAVACPPSGPTQNFPVSAVGGDYDHDDDGLVEVRTLAQLNVIRLDPDGNSLVDIDALPEYLAAFPGALDDMGCPPMGAKDTNWLPISTLTPTAAVRPTPETPTGTTAPAGSQSPSLEMLRLTATAIPSSTCTLTSLTSLTPNIPLGCSGATVAPSGTWSWMGLT